MLAAASGEVTESKTYEVWSPDLPFGFLEPLVLANFGVVHNPRVLKLGGFLHGPRALSPQPQGGYEHGRDGRFLPASTAPSATVRIQDLRSGRMNRFWSLAGFQVPPHPGYYPLIKTTVVCWVLRLEQYFPSKWLRGAPGMQWFMGQICMKDKCCMYKGKSYTLRAGRGCRGEERGGGEILLEPSGHRRWAECLVRCSPALVCNPRVILP